MVVPAAPPRLRVRATLAVAAALFAGASALTAPASALTVDSVQLTGSPFSDEDYPRDLAVTPDGNVRVLLEQWGYDGNQAQQREALLGTGGPIGVPLQLLAPSPTQGAFSLGALTSDGGAVVTFRSNKQPHPKLRSVIWEHGKPVGKPQTISDPSRSFHRGDLTASPSGAAAVTFSQRVRDGWQQRIAIRPAGAKRFLPAVISSPTAEPVYEGRSEGAEFFTTWGAGGDGVIVWTGNPTDGSVMRRITRDGTLGPAIQLPYTDFPVDGFSAVAIGPDGTILIARQTMTEGEWLPRGNGEDRQISARADALTVPAGTNTATTPVVLSSAGGWEDDVSRFAVGADVGPNGHLIVAVSGGDHRMDLYEGDGDASTLRSVAGYRVKEVAGYGDLSVVSTADGGAAAFWGSQTWTTARGPGGAWSAPELVLPRISWGISVLQSPRAMPDGGVAAVVRRDISKDVDLVPFVVRIHR